MYKTIQKIASNKVFVVVGTVALIFLMVIEVRQFLERRSINAEISQLQKQADDFTKKNSDLQSFIAYLKTDDYKQKASREQLNLRKEGEFVYSFSAQNPASVQTQDQIAADAQAQDAQISNAHKWWNYFFAQ